MAVQTLAQSPVGPIESVPNLKRRQRQVYWRQIDGIWMQTLPLPSDAVSKEAYLAKGFRLSCPMALEDVPVAAQDSEKDSLYAEIARLRAENEQLIQLKDKRSKPRATEVSE